MGAETAVRSGPFRQLVVPCSPCLTKGFERCSLLLFKSIKRTEKEPSCRLCLPMIWLGDFWQLRWLFPAMLSATFSALTSRERDDQEGTRCLGLLFSEDWSTFQLPCP